jgi:excisionase family DNA binding protein
MAQRLYTVPEAAAVLGLSRATVYRLMGEGRLESVRVGRARRIPQEAIDELVAELRDADEREEREA